MKGKNKLILNAETLSQVIEDWLSSKTFFNCKVNHIYYDDETAEFVVNIEGRKPPQPSSKP